MNALYSWNNDELIVAEHMKDLQRESQQVHLLRKAGLANTGEQTTDAHANILVRLSERLHKKYVRSHQVRPSTGSEYAK